MMTSSFPEFSHWVGVWGGWWLCAGVLHECSRASDVKSFCILFLASGKFSLIWSPAWHGTYVVSNLVFNVFFSVTVPASCRSQGYHGYLMRLTRLVWWFHLPSSRTIPQDHHSIVDEFNKILCYIYIVCPTL